MKFLVRCTFFLLLALISCSRKPEYNVLFSRISRYIEHGDLKSAEVLADSVKSICNGDRKLIIKADSVQDISRRIRLDFSLDEGDVEERLRRSGVAAPGNKLMEWENKGWLEWRMIDGEKRYFNRAASNLLLIKSFREHSAFSETDELSSRRKHITEVIDVSAGGSVPVIPIPMKITYTITVDSNAVPAGETIRCWLPFPARGNARQQNIRLLSASRPGFILSPDTAVHSTLFMEAKAVKDQPVVFSISFRYESSAQHFDQDSLSPGKYDPNSSPYKMYTREQLPQINFGAGVRRLADSIVNDGDTPPETVKKIYMWFKNNIPWSGALEYSIMPDIPGYVCLNRRGDCGMQTFLFMSMLRYKGIPVRWQSGWMVPPIGKNLHDWCEVYYENTGWVPVDVSYKLQQSDDPEIKEFYFSGIDSYRLIVNKGISGTLFPPKKYLRSEPYDFQRGEVEWSGGNLYFDKWDYRMDIEYLKN